MSITISQIRIFELKGVGNQGSYGAPYGVVVRIETDAGIFGYGESDSMPNVVRAVIEAPYWHEMMCGLKWVLIGEDPLDIDRLWRRMQRATVNYSRNGVTVSAMAAIDIALWDIKGQALGKPVHELLGGARRTSLRAYATYPLAASLQETFERARRLCDEGFTAVKFGWHPFGQDGDDDEAIVETLRNAIGDEVDLLIDGGMAFTVEQALERCRRLAPYRLFWLEEPLEAYDMEGYARLKDAAGIPIAAGELASGEQELLALADGGVNVLQIDLSRVGLTQATRIAGFAAERGVPCVNHTYSYDLNLAASLHFMAVIDQPSLLEFQATPNEIRSSLVRSPIAARDGFVDLPQGPGLGIEVDENALDRFAIVG